MPEIQVEKNSTSGEYWLKEFEALRSEIETTLNAVWWNERYAVVACGAVWSWLVVQKIQPGIAWVLPFVIVVAGWGRNAVLFLHLLVIGEYIRALETKILSPSGGWEVYFDKRRNEIGIFWLRFIGDNVVWIVLLLAALAAFYLKDTYWAK